MKSTTATIGWTWEPDGIEAAYDFDITATIYPGRPMSMYGGPDNLGWPEEPTGVEITGVTLAAVHEELATHDGATMCIGGGPVQVRAAAALSGSTAARSNTGVRSRRPRPAATCAGPPPPTA